MFISVLIKDSIATGNIRYTVLHLRNVIQFMDHIFKQGGSDKHIKREMFIVNLMYKRKRVHVYYGTFW